MTGHVYMHAIAFVPPRLRARLRAWNFVPASWRTTNPGKFRFFRWAWFRAISKTGGAL